MESTTTFLDIFRTECFWAPFISWLIAQLAKMATGFARTRRMDLWYLVSTGGMPSAHSAMVTSLSTSIGLHSGFNSPVFCVALAFALLTMFDAATVRRAAGSQARILNQMLDELFKHHKFSEKRLAELLGHTRLEVFMGMIIGILTAIAVNSIWYLVTHAPPGR